MAKRYKSRQLLPFSGRIYVEIRITDYNGHWSHQIGVSYQGDVEKYFKRGLNEAVLNALYKHMYKHGYFIKNSEDATLHDYIKSYDLKDWYVLYITEDGRYKFKSRNVNHKRYLEIRYKGKIYKRQRMKVQSFKKTDKIIQEMV